MFRTIQLRITIPFVLLILITTLGVGFYLSNYLGDVYLENLEDQMASQAKLVSQIIANENVQNDPIYLDDLAKELSGTTQTRVTIIAPNGVVIGESQEDRTSMENHLDRPEVVSALKSGLGSDTRLSRSSGYNTFYVAVSITDSGIPRAIVRLSRPISELETAVRKLQRAIMGATLIATVLATFLAVLIADKSTQPLRRFANQAMEFSQGQRTDLIAATSLNEVNQLAQAYNILADRANHQLEQAEQERNKMVAVLKELTDGVAIVNAEGNISSVNQAAADMFGISADKILGKTVAESFRQHVLVDLWAHCKESKSAQVTLLEIPANRIYLQCMATPLGESMPDNIMLLFQNLTQQRFLENVRRDFISNLSHELRTPLASLKALTETLQEGALEDPPAAQRFLQRMDAEVDALSQMVSELLELARIESGRVPLQMEPVTPCKVVNNAVERLKLQAERAHIEILIDCKDDLPDILADPPRLEQVLVNLLHNAIKFTPQEGNIVIAAQVAETHELPYTLRLSGNRLDNAVMVFSVKDTGVGIQSDDLPRIFERFYKADRARSSGGTGLGLAIARHSVEAHGGEIWVESMEGRGSTFYFYTPLA